MMLPPTGVDAFHTQVDATIYASFAVRVFLVHSLEESLRNGDIR
jgi:hypothetical protein